MNPNIKRLVFGLKCLNIIRRNFSEGKLANSSTLFNALESVREQWTFLKNISLWKNISEVYLQTILEKSVRNAFPKTISLLSAQHRKHTKKTKRVKKEKNGSHIYKQKIPWNITSILTCLNFINSLLMLYFCYRSIGYGVQMNCNARQKKGKLGENISKLTDSVNFKAETKLAQFIFQTDLPSFLLFVKFWKVSTHRKEVKVSN